jgi:hypothetical protein
MTVDYTNKNKVLLLKSWKVENYKLKYDMKIITKNFITFCICEQKFPKIDQEMTCVIT